MAFYTVPICDFIFWRWYYPKNGSWSAYFKEMQAYFLLELLLFLNY